MPSGPVSLLEAAKCGDDMLKQGVIEVLIEESPIIEQIPWMAFEGTALKHYEEGTLPSVHFRSVNEAYASSWGSDNEHFWGVAILGGEVKVDNFLVNVVGNRMDIEAKQYRKLAKANSMRFSHEAIKGTGSVASKGFKGLRALIDEGFGQKFPNASTQSQTVSLDKLDEAHDLFRNQGGADALWANRRTRRQITKAARTSVTGVSLIDVGTDVFGRQVTTWNDIPIRIVGDGINSSGQIEPVLSFDEDPGDGNATTCSAYFVKTGEDDITGLLGKGGSFMVRSFGELETAPQRMGRMEWYPGIAVFNKYSVVRVTGIGNVG